MQQISMLCLTNNFTHITGFVNTVAEYQHCPINVIEDFIQTLVIARLY